MWGVLGGGGIFVLSRYASCWAVFILIGQSFLSQFTVLIKIACADLSVSSYTPFCDILYFTCVFLCVWLLLLLLVFFFGGGIFTLMGNFVFIMSKLMGKL